MRPAVCSVAGCCVVGPKGGGLAGANMTATSSIAATTVPFVRVHQRTMRQRGGLTAQASSSREWRPENQTADVLAHDAQLHKSEGIDLDDYKQAVASIYNIRALKYDTGLLLECHTRCSSGLVQRVGPEPGERILDIAAGTGMATLPLAQAVGPSGSVVALDIAEEALAQLQAKAAGAGLDNVTVLLQDAEAADFEEGSYDAIVCSSALTWMADIPGALSTWRRRLKPAGGRIAFHAYSEKSFLTGYALSEVALEMGMPDMNPHRIYGTLERCQLLVESCGYSEVNIQMSDESKYQLLKDMQGAWDGLLRFTWPRMGVDGNPMAGLPIGEQEAGRLKYNKWLAARSVDGEVWDEHQIYYVLARK